MSAENLSIALKEGLMWCGMSDLISRQAAIDAVVSLCDDCDSGYCGSCRVNYPGEKDARKVLEDLPSAQPEHLTDEDFETIRIHLNAYKGQLCNQHRWKEAEDYQRIIDRFKAFASAEPEIVHCKTCVYITCKGCARSVIIGDKLFCKHWGNITAEDAFCSYSKRKEKDA